MIYFLILITLIITEIKYSPRLDYTVYDELLLWYNEGEGRKYVSIFKL